MRPALFALGTLLTFCVLMPATTHAGRLGNEEAVCSPQTLFMGEYIHGCMGTMRAFRDHPDPNAYAELTVRGNGQVTFQAQLNGVFLACVFPDTYDSQYFAVAMASLQNSRFVIGSRNGQCDALGATISMGSRYGDY